MTDLVSPIATLPDRGRTLKIWEISPAVDERSEVFSGDTAYSQQLHFSLSPDCPGNVNRIMLSPHTGAHADAPLHYASGEAAIGAVDLQAYLGPFRVIHCIHSSPLVEPTHWTSCRPACCSARPAPRASHGHHLRLLRRPRLRC